MKIFDKDESILRREDVLPDEYVEIVAQAEAATLSETEGLLGFCRSGLGYEPPSVAEKRRQIQEAVNNSQNALSKALHTSGIKPFSNESVEKYKARLAYEFRFTRQKIEINDGCITFLGILGFIIHVVLFGYMGYQLCQGLGTFFSLVPLLSISMILIADEFEKKNMDFVATIFGIAGLILSGIIYSFIMVEFSGPSKKKWQMVYLRGYQGNVPEFALMTARQVKLSCPEAEIMIDELVIDQKVRDPFLVAMLGGKKFYLEVWNEPGFRQERGV